MTLYDCVADVPLEVERVDLDRNEMDTSGGFTRTTTVVELDGSDAVGRGEDVTYETDDHDTLHRAHETGELDWDLPGSYTLDSFSSVLDDRDLFPEPPDRERFRQYRRWAVESAALDLALQQADTDFAAAMDRTYDPVGFVVSTRLDTDGEPTADRIHGWLDVDPALEFKLDPTSVWDQTLLDELAATDSVRILDFKNYYEGTDVDADPDPELYRRAVDTFTDTILEDVKLTDETHEALAGVHGRLSWDYPVTDVDSIRSLPVEPRWLNVKPSRFGTVEALLDAVEYCLDRDVAMYGGGQYELGVGRGQLHALASAFHPDTPNDVAPRAYNVPDPHEEVPASPLAPPEEPVGFGF